MRIQCKNCGKEYQVNENRLTPEGIRVKCKSCSSILLVRMQKKQADAQEHHESVFESRDPVHPEAAAESLAESQGESVAASETEPPVAKYRFCIQCGGRLKNRIKEGALPICEACDTGGGVGLGIKTSSMSSGKRTLLYLVILFVILLSALMGYRLAMGTTPPFTLTLDTMKDRISHLEENRGFRCAGEFRI